MSEAIRRGEEKKIHYHNCVALRAGGGRTDAEMYKKGRNEWDWKRRMAGMLEGRGRGSWVMESGRRFRLNYHSSSISPPRLCTDLVWSSSDNKAAHRNPARGTYLGSDQWAGTGWEGSRGSRECVPAASEVRKRPRMALTNFLKLGKRKECVGCSHSLLLAICTYTDRLRHGVSKYLLHTHTYLHEFTRRTYDPELKHSHHADSTLCILCLVISLSFWWY